MEEKATKCNDKRDKDGITLHLDDCCSFSELLVELDENFLHITTMVMDALIEVHVKVGNRYLTEVQQEEIRTLIRNKRILLWIQLKVMLH